jgi:hypothetical protein
MDDLNKRYDASFAQIALAAVRAYGAILNPVTGEGTDADRSTFSTPQAPQYLSREQIRGLLANSWLAQGITTLAPEHCVKEGIELSFSDDTLEGDVRTELDVLGVMDAFFSAHCAARAFGGAAIVILVDDGQKKQDGNLDLSRPLHDEDGSLVQIKELKGLYVIEGGRDSGFQPAQIAPAWAGNGDELSLTEWEPGPHFAKPVWWEWNPTPEGPSGDDHLAPKGVLIHRDRLIFFPGAYTDKETRQLLGGWDLGFLDAPYKALSNIESAQTSVVNIIYDFFTTVAKVKDYKKIVTSGEVGKLIERFQADAMARSILNMHVIDAVDEELTKVASPVSGLDGLLDRLMDFIAGAARTPRSLLFREAPRSGGQDEAGRRFWNSDIEAMQRRVYRPGLRTVIEILQAAERRPAAEASFAIGFKPIEQPSEKERAEASRTIAHADEINIKAGIYTRKEARGRYLAVGGVSELKLEGEEPPSEEEFLPLARAASPGWQREAGENVETKGKVPNATAKQRIP